MTLRSLAVTLTALATFTGLAAPAAAEVEVKGDPRGDVQRVESRGARASADILRTRGEHAGGSITVAITVVDLNGSSDLYAGVRLRTPAGAEFNAMATRAGGEKTVTLYRGLGDAEVRCPGLEGRFVPNADRITVVIPRSCVQRPRWVRFGAVVAGGRQNFYGDDARRVGGFDESNGLPRLGTRRLHRG